MENKLQTVSLNQGVSFGVQDKTLEIDQSEFENQDSKTKFFPTAASNIKVEIDDLGNGNSHLPESHNVNQNQDRGLQNLNEPVKLHQNNLENYKLTYENIDHLGRFETTSADTNFQSIDNFHKNTDTGLEDTEYEVVVKKQRLENNDNIYVFENTDSNCQDKDNADYGKLVEVMKIQDKNKDRQEHKLDLEDKIDPGASYTNTEINDLESENLPTTFDLHGSGMELEDGVSGEESYKEVSEYSGKPVNITDHASANDRKYVCSVCGQEFKKLWNLKKHILHHSTEGRFQCYMCDQQCMTGAHLKQHMKSHKTDRPHQCNVCYKQFKQVCHLKQHLLIHGTKRLHLCNVCDKDFKHASALKQHLLCHGTERPHRCDICDKRFKVFKALTDHMLIHSTERPHHCDKCDQQFKTKPHLRRHMLTHSTERPHHCGMCDKQFKKLEGLQLHMSTHSTERPHQCIVCSKQFKNVPAVKQHMRSHSTDRPHQCYVCSRLFKSVSNLKDHMISHNDERPHQCNVCGNSFKTRSYLRQHSTGCYNIEQPPQPNQ